jgi:glycosyltransferase involved in cell wall biosynthesis
MTVKVSVLMAINRVDEFTDLAVKSIFHQTFEDFEFIIVANAMSYKDFRNLKKIISADSRVVLLTSPLPSLANALNLGLASSKAKYIARMDADDISLPDRLFNQYEWLTKNSDYIMVGCKAEMIDEYGDPFKNFPFYETNKSIRFHMPFRNPLLHPAIMFLKDAVVGVGGYRYGNMSEDHELFIRLSRNQNNKFFNLNTVLFKYRRHSNQITSSENARKHYAEIFGFLFTEFLLTKNPMYLIGGILVHPVLRKFKKVFFK